MVKKRILVLGAGLAGLSAAWHLQRRGIDCRVFEKENEAGGLCRSREINGFTFDCSGHLLHFKHRYTSDLVKSLLKGNLTQHERSAWIHCCGRYSRYPFQANLYGLPAQVIRECLLGFIERDKGNTSGNKNNRSFLEWIHQHFGEGIARYFMIPYNKKFWTVSPRELTCEWLDGFIPVPSLSQIIEGTVEDSQRQFGYNAQFWYPKKGGIQAVVRAFSSRIRDVHTLHEAVNIDIKNKKVYFKNKSSLKYEILIFTLPLPEISNLIKDLPQDIVDSLRKLRYTSIFNLNLGMDRECLSDKHWIYFPEKKIIFSRVGFPHNFSIHLVPQNASSLYVEVAYSKEKPINKNTIFNNILKNLINAGVLKSSDKILVKDTNDIKYGYIIYDPARKEALNLIKNFLEKKDILCLGRYGSWSYKSMEDVILDGKRIADIF